MVSISIDLGEPTNSCFVMMPFTPMSKTLYEKVIKPAVEEVNLECIRADEIYSKPHIMSDIWKALRSARIVIAELTGKNTNVFYELGLAHAVGKPVIIVTKKQDDVPFDLKALRNLHYNTEDPSWGETLRGNLVSMLKKVLSQKDFDTVFEGIEPEGKMEYKEEKLAQRKEEATIKLSGKWIGLMISESNKIKYDLDLSLNQDVDALSGTVICSFLRNNKKIVVRQEMIGYIENSKVTLNGVTYQYIEKGNCSGYVLDNFILTLSSTGKVMTGLDKSGSDLLKVTLTKARD